jgi:ABC-type sugar transport system substrate-binding protein
MKKALAIGLAAVMAVSMSAPVFAEDEGKGIAKEDLKVGVIYIGDENEGYTAAHMKGIDEMEEKLGLIYWKQQGNIRRFSSVMQQEHRLHPADFPTCITILQIFMKHVTCQV